MIQKYVVREILLNRRVNLKFEGVYILYLLL